MSEQKEKTKVNYARRSAKYFNFWRKMFQHIVSKFWYGLQFKLIYKLKIEGKENIPKGKNYIAAGNHLSTLDPFLVTFILPRPVAFMAKKELFEKFGTRWMLDWQGAFAVNREKLEVSTIKTAFEIKNTNWVLGLFPQGTRSESGKLENIHKGFAGIAKTTKCDILPIGIVGSDKRAWWPLKGNITVKIGKIIPCSSDVDELMKNWINAIQELTGFEYLPTPA